ncbi:TRAP transporter small permease subunit [Aquabacter sp. CN5-332]|uniref:TRAP transporter small permease subunit n=1 Tax=Aquabacter sp. CN5-332 TaxID=3156608 RepID=UPI0032B5C77E
MNILLKLSQAIDRLGAVCGIIANWLVLFAVLISAGNATIRYLLNSSSNAWLEIQWYMFGGMVFLGAAYTLKLNEHVRVDLVYSAVSDRVRLWIDTIGFTVFFLPIMGYLTFLSYRFFWESFVSKEVSMNAGGLILWPAKALLPLGFAILFLQGVSELIKRVGGLTGQIQIDTHYEKPVQ